MPCLKTKEFWAPIATIKEIPRKKPVNKAEITLAYSESTLSEKLIVYSSISGLLGISKVPGRFVTN